MVPGCGNEQTGKMRCSERRFNGILAPGVVGDAWGEATKQCLLVIMCLGLPDRLHLGCYRVNHLYGLVST